MTYTELQSAVADALNRSDLTTVIKTWIPWAIRAVERKLNLHYMKASTTSLTLTTGSATIACPSRFKKPIYFYLSNSGIKHYLTWENDMDIDSYDLEYSGDNQLPNRFTRIGTNLQLDYKLASSYDHKLRYYEFSTALSADSDTNWLTENADDLIVYRALAYSAPHLGADQRLVTWAALAKDAYNALRDSEASETPAQVSLEVARIGGRNRYNVNTDRWY